MIDPAWCLIFLDRIKYYGHCDKIPWSASHKAQLEIPSQSCVSLACWLSGLIRVIIIFWITNELTDCNSFVGLLASRRLAESCLFPWQSANLSPVIDLIFQIKLPRSGAFQIFWLSASIISHRWSCYLCADDRWGLEHLQCTKLGEVHCFLASFCLVGKKNLWPFVKRHPCACYQVNFMRNSQKVQIRL